MSTNLSPLPVFSSLTGNGATLTDGSFERASFNHPQGLAYSAKRNCLYVADTESHALRCVDLSSRMVSTLAGDGSQVCLLPLLSTTTSANGLETDVLADP